MKKLFLLVLLSASTLAFSKKNSSSDDTIPGCSDALVLAIASSQKGIVWTVGTLGDSIGLGQAALRLAIWSPALAYVTIADLLEGKIKEKKA